MTRVLINPTKKDLDKAKYDELLESSQKIQRENFMLQHKIENLNLDNFWLYEIIETARQDWNKYGTEKAIIKLVLAVKEKKWK